MDDSVMSCPKHPGEVCVRLIGEYADLYHDWSIPGSAVTIIRADRYEIPTLIRHLTRDKN